ncbi:helix-turn-helix domain-containing protein, partial [Bifidobacterium vespertilionis]|uniref:helix-turn-helix domain-containing protein n=1 Tax=Bifidobacterium vespertilionis TaxID=2562524 RepID=UPI0037BF5C0A
MKKVYSHLSAEERVRIDELRNRDGLGVNEIARRTGRDKSTISRELKRGLKVRVQRERLLPSVPAETPEDGRMDRAPVLLGHDRAAQGRDTRPQVAQAPAHGVRPAA